jgi:fused signal recognition particle receptor
MDELAKISRVLKKINPQAPHETMLVLDASIGQNSLNQAKNFHEAIGITGLTITKLDGTAKAGVIFAIADTLQIPIRYIGVGEGINDLKPFNTKNFISALCDIEQN